MEIVIYDYRILFTKKEKILFIIKLFMLEILKMIFERGYLFFQDGSFFKGYFNDNNEKEGSILIIILNLSKKKSNQVNKVFYILFNYIEL